MCLRERGARIKRAGAPGARQSQHSRRDSHPQAGLPPRGSARPVSSRRPTCTVFRAFQLGGQAAGRLPHASGIGRCLVSASASPRRRQASAWIVSEQLSTRARLCRAACCLAAASPPPAAMQACQPSVVVGMLSAAWLGHGWRLAVLMPPPELMKCIWRVRSPRRRSLCRPPTFPPPPPRRAPPPPPSSLALTPLPQLESEHYISGCSKDLAGRTMGWGSLRVVKIRVQCDV